MKANAYPRNKVRMQVAKWVLNSVNIILNKLKKIRCLNCPAFKFVINKQSIHKHCNNEEFRKC